jgi:catechol 2,3-dioxygenase-like lactoylglutathione lyase family enzyme
MKLGMIMVLAPDLAEAARFYGEVLGLSLRGRAADHLVFDLAGTEFHVFACREAAPAREHTTTAETVCVFEVPDIEDAMRRMRDKGVVFLHDTPAQDVHAGIRYAAFHAPGGNVHEIMQRGSGEPGV